MKLRYTAFVLGLLLAAASAQFEPCSICDEGQEILNPDAIIDFVLSSDLTCAEIESMAMEGAYNVIQCNLIRAAEEQQGVCGCDPPAAAPESPAPTDSPVAAPVSPEPTDAPVAAPVSPEPTEAPLAAPVSPEPTESPVAAPVSPEPTDSPVEAPVSPEPTESPVAATIAPEPTDSPVAASITPNSTGACI